MLSLKVAPQVTPLFYGDGSNYYLFPVIVLYNLLFCPICLLIIIFCIPLIFLLIWPVMACLCHIKMLSAYYPGIGPIAQGLDTQHQGIFYILYHVTQ
jgi:hypothetical protein